MSKERKNKGYVCKKCQRLRDRSDLSKEGVCSRCRLEELKLRRRRK